MAWPKSRADTEAAAAGPGPQPFTPSAVAKGAGRRAVHATLRPPFSSDTPFPGCGPLGAPRAPARAASINPPAEASQWSHSARGHGFLSDGGAVQEWSPSLAGSPAPRGRPRVPGHPRWPHCCGAHGLGLSHPHPRAGHVPAWPLMTRRKARPPGHGVGGAWPCVSGRTCSVGSTLGPRRPEATPRWERRDACSTDGHHDSALGQAGALGPLSVQRKASRLCFFTRVLTLGPVFRRPRSLACVLPSAPRPGACWQPRLGLPSVLRVTPAPLRLRPRVPRPGRQPGDSRVPLCK